MTVTANRGHAGPVPRGNPRLRAHVFQRLVRAPEFGAAVAAVIIYCFFAIVGGSRGFLSLTGTASWLDTASQLGIIAVPLGMLMISGSFDLSIGSMVGAGSITVGVVTGYLHDGLWLALVVAAGAALVVGIGNGLLVSRTGLPSFIVTLAANLIVAGLGLTVALQLTGTTSVPVAVPGFGGKLFNWQWGQLSVSTLWWLAVTLVAGWVLARTRVGSWIMATGGDRERARRAGVLTSRVTVGLFVCTALASTFVGVLQAIQYSTGDPTTGQGYVFEAAIVVVIGGVLISGGYGTILGVVLGTLIYGIVDAGLFYTGWNTNYADVLIGVLMVVAVLTNNILRKLATTTLKMKRVA
jgi:simple sugar transport system permease protein